MEEKSEYQNQPVHPVSVGKLMLIGAGVGLFVILFFVLGGEPKPNWPELWWIRPVLVVPAAGALGGLFFYNMDHLRAQGGWREVIAYLISLVVFMIVLWLGTVLGLAGTMWD
ncbi:potassium transporter KefB [Pontibacter sp. BT310]|uniref:Potassium transporter KefB n=1 Tax=Pontibacter populi TaxID=890055 RepID=A0ABS6XDD2_9BACT|nr:MULTISPECIES: potassium transporter KefB [Pontibacter]MBJ6119037.1 potassium transporter KefB [Pontibacter sp. BT310]MBR0571465.1 hypothetical protein [Microvirga sp. STS03]MBW3365891.1 potassium transporter KefB [Pontibacter populi]